MADEEYYSPFIQETFSTTPNRTVREEYRERIKNIYYNCFDELNKMRKEDEKKLKELEQKIVDDNNKKMEALKQQELERKQKEAQKKKEEEEAKKNDDENEKKKDIQNNEKKDNKNEKNDDKKNEKKDEKNDKKEEKKEDNEKKEEKKEEKIIPKGLKKMEKALTLLETDYFGREQEFYEFLCKKYKIKEIKKEYSARQYFPPLISETLFESELIKCYECQQDFIKSEFPTDEFRNGYFLACNRCAPDRNNIVTLKWSEQFKSPEVVLTNNAQVAKINANGHKSACVDMKSCKSGTHCFRWKTKNYQSWFMWGISAPQKYPNNSYSSQKVFGIAGSNQSYKNGACQYNVQTNQFFGGKTEVFIDMLLDMNKGELRFVIPGLQQEAKLTGIPVNEALGYVPHINIHYSGATVQIKKIPVNWFGKNPNRVKFQY